MTKKQKHLLVRIIVAAVLFAAGGLLHLEGWAELGVYLICYAVIGWDIVWKAIANILHGQVFDENFLMTIATVGALILGAVGRANMWAAVFADVGVSVIAILNAIRAMRVKQFETPAQE